mmetsp:Transcript_422/g.1530  ORF Transcript_422/g.1530 Transcript_422/m.1530 type:complete len:250 (-) Transcript_422:891-1640(-)
MPFVIRIPFHIHSEALLPAREEEGRLGRRTGEVGGGGKLWPPPMFFFWRGGSSLLCLVLRERRGSLLLFLSEGPDGELGRCVDAVGDVDAVRKVSAFLVVSAVVGASLLPFLLFRALLELELPAGLGLGPRGDGLLHEGRALALEPLLELFLGLVRLLRRDHHARRRDAREVAEPRLDLDVLPGVVAAAEAVVKVVVVVVSSSSSSSKVVSGKELTLSRQAMGVFLDSGDVGEEQPVKSTADEAVLRRS